MAAHPKRGSPGTTSWTLVMAAGGGASPEADEALAGLCELYWYPVYGFIRRQGHGSDDAADLTQEFFARLIEKQYLRELRQERGRFRAFLVAAVRHFLSNERDRARAAKRGGGRPLLPLDVETAEGRYRREAADTVTPEVLFDRQWACVVLERVLDRLHGEMEAAGRQAQFARLKPVLTGEPAEGGYRAIDTALGMSEGAVKVAAHRLRRRYGEMLRDEIATLVAEPDAVDAELRHLASALS
jgi:DNA-directed RNA polymerase specialized sigma24 family protein